MRSTEPFTTAYVSIVSATICTFTKSVVALIKAWLLRKIKNTDFDVLPKMTIHMRQFCMATLNSDKTRSSMNFKNAVTTDTHSATWHGVSLVLRKPCWIITFQGIGYRMVGRSFVKRLAFNCYKILAFATGCNGGTGDVFILIVNYAQMAQGCIRSVLGEVIHSADDEYNGGLSANKSWFYLSRRTVRRSIECSDQSPKALESWSLYRRSRKLSEAVLTFEFGATGKLTLDAEKLGRTELRKVRY